MKAGVGGKIVRKFIREKPTVGLKDKGKVKERCCYYDEGNLQAIDVRLIPYISMKAGVRCMYAAFIMCVCVFFPFILDFNGRTSRGHTGRR